MGGEGEPPLWSMTAAEWNKEYLDGQWRFLARTDESLRYAILEDWLVSHEAAESVLDIGCGTGTLYERLQRIGYGHYVGIDISTAAIALALTVRKKQDEFIVADAASLTTDRVYSSIIFNESLYYLPDPLYQVKRFAQCLQVNGVVLISVYTSNIPAAWVARLAAMCDFEERVSVRVGCRTWECFLATRHAIEVSGA